MQSFTLHLSHLNLSDKNPIPNMHAPYLLAWNSIIDLFEHKWLSWIMSKMCATMRWVLVLHLSHQMPFRWRNKRKETPFSNGEAYSVEIARLAKLNLNSDHVWNINFFPWLNCPIHSKNVWYGTIEIKVAPFVKIFSRDIEICDVH